jgi:hypothetical protein
MEKVEFNLVDVLNCVKDGITYKQVSPNEILGYQLCALTSNPYKDYINGNLNIPTGFLTIILTESDNGSWKVEVPFEHFNKIAEFQGIGTDLSKSLELGINMYQLMDDTFYMVNKRCKDPNKVFKEIPESYFKMINFRDANKGEIEYRFPEIEPVINKIL